MSDPTVSTYWNQTTPAPDSGMQPAVIKSDNATPQDSRTISVPSTGGAVPKTANYTAVAADCGKLLSFNSGSALTYTLPATPPSVGTNQWEVAAECVGAGGLTVAATSGAKLDGVVGGTLALAQNSGCRIFTDGTDYFTQRGSASTLTLKHNGTLNGSQTTLDTKAGTGIAIADDGVGGLTFSVQNTAQPVIRGHSSGTTMSGGVQGQSNQLVATFPTGTLAGDLCVVDAAHAFNLSVPSGWTSAYWFTGGIWNGGAIYKVLTSGDIATGSVTIAAAGTYGGNWSAVSFIGATGGVREAQGTTGAGFSGTTTLTTSSAVLGTDAAVLFGATRDTGSGTATISISPGTALDTTPLTYATFCEGELADLGMTGGAQTISYTYANQSAFLLAQVIVEGVTTVGTGSVTSVGLTMPSDFAVTVTNPTTTPLIAITGGPTKSAIQQESYTYAADTGAANAYAVTLSPAPTLVAGSVVCFKAVNANTGASTLAVNGGAATAIKKNGNSTALASGDIAAGQIIDATYDGAVWQILVPGSGGSSFITSLTTTGTTGAATVVSGVLNVPQYSGGGGGGSVSFGNGPPGPAVIQANSAGTSSCAFSSSVTSGNILVVAYKSEGTITSSTCSDTVGTTYTKVASISGHSNNLNIYVGAAGGSGANTVTIGGAANNFDRTAVMELTHATATLDGSAVTVYNGSTPASLAITTTNANDILIAAIGGFHNVDVFAFSGSFALSNQSNGSDAIAVGYCATSATGTFTLSWTTSGAGADNEPTIIVPLQASPATGSDGSLYFDTSTNPVTGYVYHSGLWNKIA